MSTVAIVGIVVAIIIVGWIGFRLLNPIVTLPFHPEYQNDTPVAEENEAVQTGALLAGTVSPLLDFTKADYDAAIKTDKLIVLYFYANWCPICKEETKKALYPAFNELTTDRVVGFRINYKDNETDSDEKALAVKYGVPYQHTKVFVRNGERILKAPDGWVKARYLKEINNAVVR